MEKLVMPVWRPEGTTGDEFRDTLLALAAEQLCELSAVRALRLAVADSAVSPADNKRMASFGELPDGVVSAWVDTVTHAESLQHLLERVVSKSAAYLVTESEQLVNSESVDGRGRFPGFCQVVFLQRPDRLSEQAWLDIWQGSHTGIAIATQSTFGYRQNVIVRALAAGSAPYSAMIEENFPDQAMTSDHAFYGAPDDETLQANLTAMMESCARFIDFDRIDVIPMSEYLLFQSATKG
jgi:hypothetical protein